MATQFKLEIHRPDKAPRTFEIDAGVYTIGRDDDCNIRLSHAQVEPRHAILTIRPDGCWIEDLDANHPTTVDGVTSKGRTAVQPMQTVNR